MLIPLVTLTLLHDISSTSNITSESKSNSTSASANAGASDSDSDSDSGIESNGKSATCTHQ